MEIDPVFDIPSTFVQEFNNTNVERISENGDKNPQAYKTINRTTGNTRNGHDRAQNNYDESVVPPEYREQSLWDALFELDNYYNSPIPIVRVENHDISTMYPEGISLDINTNTIGNFTSAPHSNPPLQTQSSELVRNLQNRVISVNPSTTAAYQPTETNAVAVVPRPRPPLRTETDHPMSSSTINLQAIQIGTYYFARNTYNQRDRLQPVATFSTNVISFVIPHSKLCSIPVTCAIPVRCIGKVEAPKSGETFPAIFIHLSDSGCTNYLRNLLGFGYDPKDADYHFDPESADVNQSRITFVGKTNDNTYASRLQDILAGQTTLEIGYFTFLTILHDSVKYLRQKRNRFSMN